MFLFLIGVRLKTITTLLDFRGPYRQKSNTKYLGVLGCTSSLINLQTYNLNTDGIVKHGGERRERSVVRWSILTLGSVSSVTFLKDIRTFQTT